MTEEIVLTSQGLKKLKSELENLKNNKRKEIAARISEAKEYGDVTENAEYEDAKNDQAFVEGRISELEYMIKNAKIISSKACKDKVGIGCKVVISSDGAKETYQITGSNEADPAEGKISVDSPLGHALIDKVVGDVVKVSVPEGEKQFRIVEIK